MLRFTLMPLIFACSVHSVFASDASPLLTAKEITQYGITWTFNKPAQVGRFVNGDFWVIGPVIVVGIMPLSTPGRSGSAINPKAGPKQSYDDRLAPYDPTQRVTLPLTLMPGQSLVSVESLAKVGESTAETQPGGNRSYLRTAAVLTCVKDPPPSDAFRPAYVGDIKTTWTVGQLKRDLLPKLQLPSGIKKPSATTLERRIQRLWLDSFGSWNGAYLHPVENMPSYAREMTSIISDIGLLLLLDDPTNEHENLLRLFVQLGIDLYGIAQSNNRIWIDNGGHASGRKWPILFAGLLLGSQDMCRVKAAFGEDDQTYYGNCWTGAKVCWGGFHAFDVKQDHEHIHPGEWTVDGRGKPGDPPKGAVSNGKLENYRMTCTSHVWVGEALAAHLIGMAETWDHPAFFDYVDRWMSEDDTEFQQIIMDACGYKERIWMRQRSASSEFVQAMWTNYRKTVKWPSDRWKTGIKYPEK